MTFEVGSLGTQPHRVAPRSGKGPLRVRLTQIDGKLPNLALMKLSHWHRAQGDEVYFSRSVCRGLFEPDYDIVYGSTIFAFAKANTQILLTQFPEAIVGGTGSDAPLDFTVERHLGIEEYEHYDYSHWPNFLPSLGFTARGCRLACGFCKVPRKEGRPRSVNTINDIWRGDPHKRWICLMDNDFFGNPHWRERAQEIRDGGFRVCFNQGISVRLITDEAAECLGSLPVYDDQFRRRRLYTAWDNLKDEAIFMKGVKRLEKYGFNPRNLLVYMLIGFDPSETLERILYRFNRLVDLGCKPYPMVCDNKNKELRRFQRWAVVGAHRRCSFRDYDPATHDRKRRHPTNEDAMTFAEAGMIEAMEAA